jgi:hypothetical protein
LVVYRFQFADGLPSPTRSSGFAQAGGGFQEILLIDPPRALATPMDSAIDRT